MIDLEITWILGPFILWGPPYLCQVTHCPNVKDPCVRSHSALRLSSQMPVKRHIPPVSFLGSQRNDVLQLVCSVVSVCKNLCQCNKTQVSCWKNIEKSLKLSSNSGDWKKLQMLQMMCSHFHFFRGLAWNKEWVTRCSRLPILVLW